MSAKQQTTCAYGISDEAREQRYRLIASLAERSSLTIPVGANRHPNRQRGFWGRMWMAPKREVVG